MLSRNNISNLTKVKTKKQTSIVNTDQNDYDFQMQVDSIIKDKDKPEKERPKT